MLDSALGLWFAPGRPLPQVDRSMLDVNGLALRDEEGFLTLVRTLILLFKVGVLGGNCYRSPATPLFVFSSWFRI